jgi:hypothetical protein
MANRLAAVAIITLLATPADAAEVTLTAEQLDRELERRLDEFDRSLGRENSGQEVDILSQNGRAMPLDNGSAFDEVGADEIGATVVVAPTEDTTIAGRASEGSGMEAGDRGDEQTASEGRDGAQATPGGGQGGAANLPLPDDIGDGQGDGIVLRQIREAAMRETDPVLRDKLWQEYRRIKGQ